MLDRRHEVPIVLTERIEEFERACIKRCVETREGGGGVGGGDRTGKKKKMKKEKRGGNKYVQHTKILSKESRAFNAYLFSLEFFEDVPH